MIQKEQLQYILKLMEFLEENPLPESEYFNPVLVIKDLETDTSYGVIKNDDFGKLSYFA